MHVGHRNDGELTLSHAAEDRFLTAFVARVVVRILRRSVVACGFRTLFDLAGRASVQGSYLQRP
jgi:hypothetical protein